MTTFTGTIPTIASGDTTTVPTNLATYRDALKALSEAQTAWTPTYTNITIGNAVVSAKYLQVGKFVRGHLNIVFGSTSSFGAGSLLSSLPVAPHASIATGHPVGHCYFLDNSAGSASRTIGSMVTSGGNVFFVTNATGGTVSNTVPWTWAVSDVLACTFEYEAA